MRRVDIWKELERLNQHFTDNVGKQTKTPLKMWSADGSLYSLPHYFNGENSSLTERH